MNNLKETLQHLHHSAKRQSIVQTDDSLSHRLSDSLSHRLSLTLLKTDLKHTQTQGVCENSHATGITEKQYRFLLKKHHTTKEELDRALELTQTIKNPARRFRLLQSETAFFEGECILQPEIAELDREEELLARLRAKHDQERQRRIEEEVQFKPRQEYRENTFLGALKWYQNLSEYDRKEVLTIVLMKTPSFRRKDVSKGKFSTHTLAMLSIEREKRR